MMPVHCICSSRSVISSLSYRLWPPLSDELAREALRWGKNRHSYTYTEREREREREQKQKRKTHWDRSTSSAWHLWKLQYQTHRYTQSLIPWTSTTTKTIQVVVEEEEEFQATGARMSAEETNKQTNKRLQLRFSVQALLAAVTGQTFKGTDNLAKKNLAPDQPRRSSWAVK